MAARGVTDINTLEISGSTSRTIDIGVGNTLRLGASGGVWLSSNAPLYTEITIGKSGSAGTLTAGGGDGIAGELVLGSSGVGATASRVSSTALTVNSTIADNGAGSVRVIVGTSPYLDSQGVPQTINGAVEFRAANTYTGGTWVNYGMLRVTDANGLGTGLVTVAPPSGVDLSRMQGVVRNDFVLGGLLVLGSSLGDSSSILTLDSVNVTVGAYYGQHVINSKITGAYGMPLSGTGSVTLTNNGNDFQGDLVIGFSATVRVGAAGGVLPHGFGKGNVLFDYGFGSSDYRALDLNGFDLTINGLGTQESTSSTAAHVTNSAAGSGTATLTLGDGDATTTFSGLVQDGPTAKTAITKIGGGVQTFSYSGTPYGTFAANTYSGATAVQRGVLQAGSSGAFSAKSAYIISAQGRLRLNGFSNAIGSLAGDGIVLNGGTTAATLTLGGDNSSTTFSGSLQDGLGGGVLSLTKVGTGTQTLSGVNTYTGVTRVLAGKLILTGSLTSDVTVSDGALFVNNSTTPFNGTLTMAGNGPSSRATLSGRGTIGSAIALNNIGSTLSPGNSPGILTFTTGQTWNSFTYDWETNDFKGTGAGVNFDQVVINSSLALTGGPGSYRFNVLSLTSANLSGTVANFEETTQTWQVLTTTGGITGFDATNWTLDMSGFATDVTPSGSFALQQSGNNLQLVYTPVPEPSGAVLVGAGLAVAGLKRRR